MMETFLQVLLDLHALWIGIMSYFIQELAVENGLLGGPPTTRGAAPTWIRHLYVFVADCVL